MKRVVHFVVTGLLVAAPLAAQQHQAPHGMGAMQQEQPSMMGGMSMMEALGPGPMMLIRAATVLGLTDAQVERLNAIHEAAHAEHARHQESAMQSRHAAMEALSSDDPDLAGFEAAMRAHHEAMLQGQMSMVRAHVEAAGVLTDGQRQTLETAAAVMKAMHGDQGMMQRHSQMHPDTSGVR